MSIFSEWMSKRWGSVLKRRGRIRRRQSRSQWDTAISRVEALEDRLLLSADFGDAPDDGVAGNGPGDYTTLLSSDGPRHAVDTAIFLGGNIDMEADALANAQANGDDVAQALPIDEDGLVDPLTDLQLTVGTQPRVRLTTTNTTGSTATLSGWIDYNQDGVFDNATERAQIAVPDGTDHGVVTLVFPTVPVGAVGDTYARFRLSTDGAAEDSTGAADDGEVEDYRASILLPASAQVQSYTKIAHETNGGPSLSLDYQRFGRSVAALGDLNHDGVTDLAVGVHRDNTGDTYRGAVHILFMNADGTVASTAKINSDTPNGPALPDNARFGVSVASLGDLDGDGVTDILVGASAERFPSFTGAAYIVFLNADGSAKRTTRIDRDSGNGLESIASQSYFGSSVAAVGDLDNDGVTEIAIGAPVEHTDENGDTTGRWRGAVHLIYLNADGTVKNAVKIDDSTPNGPVLSDFTRFGASVAGIGDLNGDGIGDLAVGTNETSGDRRGGVHILFLNADGSVQGTTRIDESTENGPGLREQQLFGVSVASLGDVDGDGVNDLAVGSYWNAYNGAVHIVLLNSDGSVKLTTPLTDQVSGRPGFEDTDLFGRSIANLGDINGDGLIDLAVGADGDDTGGNSFGAVYILNLAAPGWDFADAPDDGLFGHGPGDYTPVPEWDVPRHVVDTDIFMGGRVDADFGPFANTAASGDDVNQALPDDEDGLVDPLTDLQLTVGAQPRVRVTVTNNTGSDAILTGWIDYNHDGIFHNATERAQVVVPDGTDHGVVTLVFPTVPEGTYGETFARFRLSTDLAAVDATGAATDGEVEDYGATITRPASPEAFHVTKIAHESNGGPTLIDDDRFGGSVTAIGDLNNDGVTDLAVGAWRDSTGGAQRGAVHLLFMNADGTVDSTVKIDSTSPGAPVLTDQAGFGIAVANLGDLDGDGVNDLAVGTPRNGGAVHVLFLNSDGTIKNTEAITQSGSYFFGTSVAPIGDLDGDGVTEIVVGDIADPTDESGGVTGSARGAAYIVFLNADGTAKSSVKIDDSTPGGPELADFNNFGLAVAGLGDVNGDGVSDIAVGVGEESIGDQRGRVHIFFLNADGSIQSSNIIDETVANGPSLQDGEHFGRSIANVGDLDGNGVNDLAVGAADDTYGPARGAVHVVLLNADGSVKATTELAHETNGGPALSNGDLFGSSVAAIGDLNGDGYTDLAVGAERDSTGGTRRGAVYVLNLGRADFADAPDDGVPGNGPGDYSTSSDSDGPRHAIDANIFMGGNIDDELDASPNAAANGDDVGQALPDDEDGLVDPLADLQLTVGTQPRVRVTVTNNTGSDATLSGWIDYNQDGVFDSATERAQMIVPAGTDHGVVTLVFPMVPVDAIGQTYARFRLSTDSAADNPTGFATDGEVEDYSASMTLPSTGTVDEFIKISHETNGGPTLGGLTLEFGASVASIGDLNNDGVTDMVVGVGRDSTGGPNRGAVYILFMNADGTVSSARKIDSDTPNNLYLTNEGRFGQSVANLGDLDGDGVTDIAVGAPSGPLGYGTVHILFLNDDGSVKYKRRLDHVTSNGLDSVNLGSMFGRSVSVLGDLDGDGVTEIAVGASQDVTDENGTATGIGRGSVFIVYLNADGTSKHAVRIDDSTAGGPDLMNFDRFGNATAGLGDLDGDGVGDLAVGIPEAGETGQHGRVQIFFLNADGSIKNSTTIEESNSNIIDFFGNSLANVGDLNADGVTDLAVGAYDGGVGQFHILYLNADGTVKARSTIGNNQNGGPQLPFGGAFGTSIANLGDLNGDGVIELAVGAPRENAGGSAYGALYVLSLEGGFDFGDAPTGAQSGFANSYPVTAGDNGARHVATGPQLGANRDVNADGLPEAGALGDDSDSVPDDEDGVSFVTASLIAAGTTGTGYVRVDLQNPDSVSNRLDAYIDFNQDGIWEESEKIFDALDLGTAAGEQLLEFDIPADTKVGTTFARFRLSKTGGLDATGAAPNGEVEDHALTFVSAAPPKTEFTGPVSRVGDRTVTLTWNEAPQAETYELRVYNTLLGEEFVHQILPAGTTSFTFPVPLDPFVTYAAYIRAVNAAGPAPYSRIDFYQEQNATAADVPELTGPVGNVQDDTVMVTWGEFADAQDYTLYLYNVKTGREILRQNVGAVTQFETPPLPTGNEFQVFVQANTSAGQHPISAPLNFTVEKSYLPAPEFRQTALVGEGPSPRVEFMPVPGALDYEVWIYDTAAGQLVQPPTRTGGRSYVDLTEFQSVVAGRMYQLHVRGVNQAGDTGYFNRLEFTGPEALGNPAITTIDFEAAAYVGAGRNRLPSYSEDGFVIAPWTPLPYAMSVWGDESNFYPGSAAISNESTVVPLNLMRSDSGVFSLKSLSISEYRQSHPATDVTFLGTRVDGSTISRTLTTDGEFGFEEFDFSGFEYLVNLSWTTGQVGTMTTHFHLDNIVLEVFE